MKILIVQTGFLGDVVLTTPVIANLRKMFPAAELVMMTTPEAKPLVEFHPDLNRVIVFDKRGVHRGLGGFLEMRRRLREERFSIVFSLHKSARTAALLALSGIAERYGFREAALPFLYTRTVRRKHLPHEALRNLVILENVGAKLGALDSRLTLGIPDEARAEAAAVLGAASGKIAGIAPGSVWATKRWTPSGFAAVADELLEMGWRVVVLGGPKDKEAAASVEQLAGGTLVNLTGKTSLIVSAAIIEKLGLLVTNDSAPLHIASACNVPVVAAFCATIPEFGFGPWNVAGESVGVHGLSCRPCGRHGGNECPTGTHACQLRLRPETVMDAAQRVLAEHERTNREAA